MQRHPRRAREPGDPFELPAVTSLRYDFPPALDAQPLVRSLEWEPSRPDHDVPTTESSEQTMVDPLLVVLHTRSNTGYAIAPLERVFLRMARTLVTDDAKIHFAYRSLDSGRPETLPATFNNIVALDIRSRSRAEIQKAEDYVRRNGIRTVFAFDAPVSLPSFRPMRRAGVERIISYQGAPMSSLFTGWRLQLRRLEVRTRPWRPDHFIFESEAMRETAVYGRGIPRADTSVVYLGVDGARFRPIRDRYAHRVFGIPLDRCLVVYSGHMEPRKGVHVLIEAFSKLVNVRGRRDLHLLILGNKPGQMERFQPLYSDTAARDHITFGGYRNDVTEIFGSADVGAIASTGWDSFTMSSVEMAASGLPLVVSHLQGLVETVDPGKTGYTFPPGDAETLAGLLERLADDPALREQLGRAARERALARHSIERQVNGLTEVVRRICAS